MRIISSLFLFAIFAYGGWWIWNNNSSVQQFVLQKIDSGQFRTIEQRFTAEQIMAIYRAELLIDEEHTFLDPELLFQPYLLMEVKYAIPNKNVTREGTLLWSQEEGEIVLDTRTWETTHGFEDAICTGADTNDFLVINAIAAHGGSITRDKLFSKLNTSNEVLDAWIDNARRKHLIVRAGNKYRLHFSKPKLNIMPNTKMNDWIVSKPYKNAIRVPKKYTRSQIARISKAAFGNQFTIRNITEVFLPVHSIKVQNPDGSTKSSYWNAVNGKRIIKSAA